MQNIKLSLTVPAVDDAFMVFMAMYSTSKYVNNHPAGNYFTELAIQLEQYLIENGVSLEEIKLKKTKITDTINSMRGDIDNIIDNNLIK